MTDVSRTSSTWRFIKKVLMRKFFAECIAGCYERPRGSSFEKNSDGIIYIFRIIFSLGVKKLRYTIKSYIASNGERFSQIYDADEKGFPLFYPTAYVSRSIRHRVSHGTQKVYLDAIKRVCEWEARQKVDLALRFQKRVFLTQQEIDSLANHLKAPRRGGAHRTANLQKGNTYIAYAAKYLEWLAGELITDSSTADIRAAIDDQNRKLTGQVFRKRGSLSGNAQRIMGEKLDDDVRQELMRLFDAPFSRIYRAADRGPRLRNVIMLRILYETGMRRGEVLSLKLRNFQESAGNFNATLVIERNHHDEFDTRVNQPVAKTDGRTLPISHELENQILGYISAFRAEVPAVGFSNEDFIFINHRAGPGQGRPMSISTFDSAFMNLRRTYPSLVLLHAHLFRHDWNYRFSEMVDKHGLNFSEERELREILMGWRFGSAMSHIYNQRHIQEKATAYAQVIANDTEQKSGKSSRLNLEKASALALVIANDDRKAG